MSDIARLEEIGARALAGISQARREYAAQNTRRHRPRSSDDAPVPARLMVPVSLRQ